MNVLLVDDQERILIATKKLVNWDRLGVQEVFIADSAAVARKILEANKVDIMLTDMMGYPCRNGRRFIILRYVVFFSLPMQIFRMPRKRSTMARLITSCSLQAFRISRKPSAGASGS